MQNKIVVFILSVGILFGASPARAEWGIGGNYSYWKSHQDDLDLAARGAEEFNNSAGLVPVKTSVDQSHSNWESEAFYEHRISHSMLLGATIGYGQPATTDLHINSILMQSPVPFPSANLENNAWVIPFSLYAKFKPEAGRWSLYGGAGGDWIHLRSHFVSRDVFGNSTGDSVFTSHRLAPHVLAGAEYFPVRWLSIGVQVKEIFDAKIGNVDDGQNRLAFERFNDAAILRLEPVNGTGQPYQPDFGGFRIGVTTRIYFGGNS